MLEKATLICIDDKSKSIDFMFNPKELSFEGNVESNENKGSRSEKSGKPKVSFSNIKSYAVKINNILIDTYETGENVLNYINFFKNAVKFVDNKQRPPIYKFSWGKQVYLEYCFVEKVNYKLTMFLSDGTPVRAVIDNLSLKETDSSVMDDSKPPKTEPDRKKDSQNSRLGKKQRRQ
ncbi:MAG: hypothetical protein KME64_12200 [Scytonematopsis contorta HA4267-MV1]|jgi:hypothetical protein|nr:hypothetical protein [Scytonematopsis contorta HA4267-MV1]